MATYMKINEVIYYLRYNSQLSVQVDVGRYYVAPRNLYIDQKQFLYQVIQNK